MLLAACASGPATTATVADAASTEAGTVTAPAASASPSTTPTATVSPEPSSTPAPAATPTPAAALTQLTTGACCTGVDFAPDSSAVWFIDKPGPDAPAGIYAVPVEGGAATLVTDKLGIYSPDFTYRAYLEGNATYIDRPGSDERYYINNAGRAVSFSPDSQQIVWQASTSFANFDQRLTGIWLADVTGENPREVLRLQGGAFAGWFPEGERWLLSQRNPETRETELLVYTFSIDALTPLVSTRNLRQVRLDPGGTWLAYTVTFSGDATQDGLWLLNINSGERYRLDEYGAFTWRAPGRLVLLPQRYGAASDQVLEIDAATGAVRALTDPDVLQFRIAEGDWALSPDGQHLAFVSAADDNIWLLSLP